MPISEDGLDNRNQQSNNEPTSTMSKAELRKTHKPIMEKRRRARINHCLNEIKALILEAMKKDPARHSKLEKADILEMAVRHLQNVQRQQLAMAIAGDPSVLRKFKTGFDECAREISIYIGQMDERQAATGLNDRIAAHLTKCIGGIEQIARFNFPGFPAFVTDVDADANGILATASRNDTITDDMMNNDPRMQRQQETSSSIRLIPSRLPTGELAFLVPNSFANLSNLSSLLGGETKTNFESDKRRNSAFVTVKSSSNLSVNQHHRQDEEPSISTISPPPSPARAEDSPTGKGFRPVNSTALQRSYRSAFLSTAKLVRNSEDLKKQIEYSHQELSTSNKNRDNNNIEKIDRKIAEPLCVITNQSERFKHAQVPEETIDCEENIRGVKRKRYDNASETDTSSHYGLLMASASDSQDPCQSKAPKASNDDYTSQFRRHPRYNLLPQANTSVDVGEKSAQISSQSSGRHCDDNSESSNDMWRPW